MSSEELIENCHFVPMSIMKRVIESLEESKPDPDRSCKRNLLKLQEKGSSSENDPRQRKWRHKFHLAVSRAIYSHNWDKLLYLLHKSPVSEHKPNRHDELPIYIRALTILLMNHPIAKERSLLSEYLHMVLSCRTDEHKKALNKVLLSLTDKIYGRNNRYI